MIGEALGLAAASLLSEDLACVAAGVLIARGEIDPAAALAGCGTGIWLGDIGLWALGRSGAHAANRSRWLAPRLSAARLNAAVRWIDERAAAAIVTSRFLPGARLPVYVAAGAAGVSLARFAAWSAVAAGVWTPLLVLGSMQIGTLAGAPGWSGNAPAAILVAAVLAAAWSLRRLAPTPDQWNSISARLARWRRWEFWPMWLFYAPVAAWISWLTVRHAGGFSVMAAANPGIPDGGTVGESKAAILAALPPQWTIPHLLVGRGGLDERVQLAVDGIAQQGWTYPVIMKPDVGQRGTGVKLVSTSDGVRQYMSRTSDPVIVQPYHPGPFEAGIFYYRYPGRKSGRIFSITDKEFPAVVGDGTSTLARLVRAHPRYRMQASLFLARHHSVAEAIVPAGETMKLGVVGNHAQGAVFRDGSHLITPALERRIDAIARLYPGFFVGRFDVRYSNVAAFKEGRDLAIVELNGAAAESTNVYDPGGSLISAYRTLFRQWSIVFAIGAANRRRGVAGSSCWRLARLIAIHLAARPAFEVSD